MVVSILVGLEVSNWNAERKFTAQERSLLRDAHGHPEIKHQLGSWIGQNIFATGIHPSMRSHGEAAITAITEQLAAMR